MMKIEIAGLPVEWQDDYSDFVKDFLCRTDEPPVMTVRFEQKMSACHGIEYCEKPSANVIRLANGELLCADGDWSRATAYFMQKSGEFSLALAAIISRFAFYGAFLVHASCVNIGGEGVIFTGPSGAGKTTQAKLWQEHLGAEIINGDKAILREAGGFYAFGLPWKGSSEFCLNKKTRLKGIVIVRQAKKNRLTVLQKSELVQMLLPHVFLPMWCPESTDAALEAFEKFILNVPVMLLECLPDEEAVRLVYGSLFG